MRLAMVFSTTPSETVDTDSRGIKDTIIDHVADGGGD